MLPAAMEVDSAAARPSVAVDEALRSCDTLRRHEYSALLAALAITLCGGMGGAIMPFLMEPIATEFSYDSWERSVLASSQFVGMWIGSIVGGVIADASGPGRAMMLSLVGLTVGGVAPTILPNLASSARVLVGLSLTISYQAGNSWLAESIPTSSRSLALSALHISIAVGGLLSVGLAVLIDAWRPLLLVNTAPTVIVGLLLGRFVLRHESARWLLVSGRHDRALEVLRRIARRSGAAPPHALHEEGGGGGGAKADEASTLPLARAGGGAWRRRWRELRHKSLWRLHVLGSLVCFTLNFGSKGAELWMGAYVTSIGLDSISRSVYFASQGGKIVGDLLNIRFSHRVGRLRALQLSFFGAGAALLAFCFATTPPALLALAFLGTVCQDIVWCNVYMYLAEAYPTSVRNSAFGLVMGAGRFGGILSTALGGVLPSIRVAFVLQSVAFVGGGFLSCAFGLETSRRSLRDAV